jgi:hypothetical protein
MSWKEGALINLSCKRQHVHNSGVNSIYKVRCMILQAKEICRGRKQKTGKHCVMETRWLNYTNNGTIRKQKSTKYNPKSCRDLWLTQQGTMLAQSTRKAGDQIGTQGMTWEKCIKSTWYSAPPHVLPSNSSRQLQHHQIKYESVHSSQRPRP